LLPCGLKEAKIAGYTWHSNRHTFCSWLAMAGRSMKDIQTLAGHKTITMAARYRPTLRQLPQRASSPMAAPKRTCTKTSTIAQSNKLDQL